jgi:hypothetical protein
MWERIHQGLRRQFDSHPQVQLQLAGVQAQVLLGALPASVAARQLLALGAIAQEIS